MEHPPSFVPVLRDYGGQVSDGGMTPDPKDADFGMRLPAVGRECEIGVCLPNVIKNLDQIKDL
jgi:hypothetical protein